MSRFLIILLLVFFLLFYFLANYFLSKNVEDKKELDEDEMVIDNTYEYEKKVINTLYNNVKILYDVVNNKFIVDQDDTIEIGNIVYKKIINFDDIMNSYFTLDGISKYVDFLDKYFAKSDDGYYLAGNLVTYQTYYFRGDNTNIFVTTSSSDEINGIIYEKWTSNNKNTLATIRVVKEDNKWLIDDITILISE